METAGFVEQFGYGWLHIQLNTLLPHCRYQTADWLSDTIRRLLDEYVAGGSELDVCHITLLDIVDAADFFAYRSGDYAVADFYGGSWGC